MVLTDKLKNISSQVQQGTTQASLSLTHAILRFVSSFFIGYVLALIIQEMTKSGSLMLLFTTLVLMFSFYKAFSRLSLIQIIVFDLICVLIGTLLRLYIQIAPN